MLRLQVALDDDELKVYTLTAAQADEGEGTKNLKLRNVKGQGGVSFILRALSERYVNTVHTYSCCRVRNPAPTFSY